MSTTGGNDEARVDARRQLSRVLLVLAALDVSVLILVIGLAVAWSRLRFPTAELVGLMVGGVATIVLIRIALGVRLKRRSGHLF
jgi:hypothetical protein